MKKVFSFLAAALFAVSMFAADFVKVTEAPANWAGEYVLVYEADTVAYAFTGVDAAPGSEAVAIAANKITNYTGVTITVAALAEGGYSVAVKGGDNNGKFLASGSSAPTYSNALKFIDAAQRIDLAYADGAVVMSQIADKAAPYDSIVSMRFNKAKDQKRFRFYKSGQEPVQLYRLAEVGPTPDPEYVVEGSIAGTLTPATPALLTTGWSGATINRGGFALGSDALYFANNTTGHMGKMQLDLSAFADDADSIGKGFYMDIDAAGHYVIYEWTGGSASLDIAQVYGADKQLIRRDTLGLLARCDMPACVGDLTAGRAAYFTACNAANAVLRYNVVDGVMTSVDTIVLGFAMGGNNSVSALDVDHFTVQSRGNALAYVDCSGAAPVVTNMSYFGASTFTSAYGGQVFKFAGHVLYVMGTYKVGGYMGSFAVFDITDPAKPYMIAEEPSKLTGSAMGTACVTFRVKVEGQTATIYEYAAFQVRKYALTVTPACYLKQGNEGAEWVSMTAGENGFTYDAVLAADSLYINGQAADAGATMFKLADATVNGTVAINDTVRFTYNNGALTIDSLGHFVPTLTFNVVVPENTPGCYIAGSLNSWSFTRMVQLDATHYTYTWRAENAVATGLEYKYCAGADWAYVEKGANGEELANRAYAENDTVATWLAVPTAKIITYELNGGVVTEYGWTSKGAIALDLQNDYNTAYSATKAWAKQEDGKYYYKCGENWVEENAAAGQASTVTGFIQNVTYNTSDNLKNLVEKTDSAKYYWLVEVIKANRANQGLPIDAANMVENLYRKELSGFFLASPAETSWPAASNFTTTAGADFYAPIWKKGLANPETVNAAFTLNAPYKEGYTFDGWYANADFSGAKVTTIDENTPSCTLYAKWIEYVSTIAEANAALNDSVTTAGVVTYVRGSNVYIQDASAATLLYLAKGETAPVVGDKVTVRGKSVLYGGAPEISGAVIKAKEANQPLPAAVEKTIAELKANNDTAALKVFGQRVKVLGVKIAKYDDKGNAYVTDGVDTVQCYYMVANQTTFPVGMKVNLTALVGYYKKFQFVGDVAGFEVVVVGKKDAYNYPARGEQGEYTLENKWIISEVEDNFASNKPASNDFARGMVAKDGKMYFINREKVSFTVVDGATGEMLDPIMIKGEHLFQVADSTGKYADAVTLKFNDVKIDNAGNFLIGACVSGGQHFMIYKVDMTTGNATLLIDERLFDNPDFGEELQGQATAWRFDAFGVYGDVNNSAIIMGADANSFNVYKWTITNGVAGLAEKIDASLDPETDESLLIDKGAVTVAAFGTAPQIFPVDEDYFYVDGWNTLPMLYDMDGVLADDFIHSPKGTAVVNNAGDTCKLNQGHNGLCEFQVGDEYFMIMAATNTVGTPNSAFALYKFADAAKSFDGLEPLWYFPANGMGAATNGCRTAVPSVEVNGNKATLYVYTNNNGYGVYEFTGKAATGFENLINDAKVEKFFQNGQLFIRKNGVVYTVLGVKVL